MKRTFLTLLTSACVALLVVTGAHASSAKWLDTVSVSVAATSMPVFMVPDLQVGPSAAEAFRPAEAAAIESARKPLDARPELSLAAKGRMLNLVTARDAGRSTVPKRWHS